MKKDKNLILWSLLTIATEGQDGENSKNQIVTKSKYKKRYKSRKLNLLQNKKIKKNQIVNSSKHFIVTKLIN